MRFVIQEHRADKAGLHWDLRLEAPAGDLSKYREKRATETVSEEATGKAWLTPEPVGGGGAVLKSYAIPKHKLPDAGEKPILAIPTEDHPVEYLSFQGTIPKGQYGAGEMRIVAQGEYSLAGDALDLGPLGAFRMIPWQGKFLLARTR